MRHPFPNILLAILLYSCTSASDYLQKANVAIEKEDSAIIVYSQLISFDPNNTLALYNVGLCKYRQEKFEEAINYFNKALITKGYNPEDTSKSQFTMEYTQFGK
jgi:tetratricopeptide (TPR) repeat protein